MTERCGVSIQGVNGELIELEDATREDMMHAIKLVMGGHAPISNEPKAPWAGGGLAYDEHGKPYRMHTPEF